MSGGRALRATFVLVLLLSSVVPAFAGPNITSARFWPAPEYTRLTLESDAPIRHSVTTVKNPDRLVIDMEEVEAGIAIKELPAKVGDADPYVKAVRLGRPGGGVLRLVLDLRTEVIPQIFALKPVADYGHRLVVDVYPASPADPLMALFLQQEGRLGDPPAAAKTHEAVPPARAPEAAAPLEKPDAPKRAGDRPRRGKPEPAREVVIAIDAGHGGEDPGARGRHGTREKDVTLAIARKLKAKVDADPAMKAVMIRDGDLFVPLAIRVEKARRAQADLFLSIHADAWIKPSARGSSVFALSERGATSTLARWIAKKENEADLIGGVNLDVADPYLKKTLLDLSQTAQINDSLKLGKQVLAELGEINHLHKDEVEQAGFAVLKAPDIPSILVETAFISNPDEEKRLRSERYQDRMADAIYQGIKRYFSKNPPVSRIRIAERPAPVMD